jgi:hypothetical protein
MRDGSIERCQICGITLARIGSDGFTCDHCLGETMEHFGLKRRRVQKARKKARRA